MHIYRTLYQRLLIVLLMFSISRLLFLLFNLPHFTGIPASEIALSFFYGLRFDISAVSVANFLFIAMHLFAFNLFEKKWYQKTVKIVFYITNIPALFANSIDLIYYRFTFKRTASDIFHLFGLGDDMNKQLPQFVKDFWFILLIIAGMIVIMEWLYRKTQSAPSPVPLRKNILIHTLLFAATIPAVIYGFRGGFQLRPIGIISAAEHGSPRLTPLILNTPFCIYKSLGKNRLDEVNYFSKDSLDKIHSIRKHYQKNNSSGKPNVVLIVLESFSKEYIGSLNGYEGYTPFLDSLMQESLYCTDAFANGKKSIEGIPAIIAGIPALMDNPYITSSYSGNKMDALPGLLEESGYTTAFFHGGNNGTMGFDHFANMAGFSSYYGRKEYNNDRDYDGTWGIWDEEFFQYTAKNINNLPVPFFVTLFSLSSHHPYPVPDQYKGVFKEGTLPIHKSIRYADNALRKFFETASKAPWFDQTLFIITADHTAPAEYPFYQTRAGMYGVPLLFYRHNSSLKGKITFTVQHADILPSVLDYTGYNKPFVSFGESILDSSAFHFAAGYISDIYQLISDGALLQTDGIKTISLHHYRVDSLLRNNLAGSGLPLQKNMEEKLKAIIQHYHFAMIHNKMSVDRE